MRFPTRFSGKRRGILNYCAHLYLHSVFINYLRPVRLDYVDVRFDRITRMAVSRLCTVELGNPEVRKGRGRSERTGVGGGDELVFCSRGRASDSGELLLSNEGQNRCCQ